MAFILCVDDEESISTLIKQILKLDGHEVAHAINGREALKSLELREPDLIVLDRSMPFMDGITVCQNVKSNPFLSRIPVLMLTAQATIEDKVEGFEAGADDYLVKPFEPRELSMRVTALLRLVQRESDRNPSSGLPGGRAIAAQVEELLAKGEEFTVLYFDLDHFKPFADTFGFAAADLVITGVGALLGDLAQSVGAFAGHIGGDDFLLIAEATEGEALAQRALSRYKELIQQVVGEDLVQKGRFTGLDRDGQPRDFALAGLTVVLVPVDPATWISLSHLGEAAATWKKAVRARGTDSIVVALMD